MTFGNTGAELCIHSQDMVSKPLAQLCMGLLRQNHIHDGFLPLGIKLTKKGKEFGMGFFVDCCDRTLVLVHAVFFLAEMPGSVKLEKIQNICCSLTCCCTVSTGDDIREFIEFLEQHLVLIVDPGIAGAHRFIPDNHASPSCVAAKEPQSAFLYAWFHTNIYPPKGGYMFV